MFSEITLNLSKNLKSLLIKKNMHLLITDPAPPQPTPSCECLTRLLQKQLTLKNSWFFVYIKNKQKRRKRTTIFAYTHQTLTSIILSQNQKKFYLWYVKKI